MRPPLLSPATLVDAEPVPGPEEVDACESAVVSPDARAFEFTLGDGFIVFVVALVGTFL